MRRLIYAEEAKADLTAIGRYIAEQAGYAIANDLLERIRLRIENIPQVPKSHPVVPELGPGLRRMIVDRYLILYRVDDSVIYIIRVLHSARDISATLMPR